MTRPDRRHFLTAAAALPVLALAACATPLGDFSLDEGVRRLLTLSSQRAFARLLQPGGFYDDQLTRLIPPAQLTGGGNNAVLAAVLRTNAVRSRVAIAVNDVATDAADRATPVVTEAIRGLSAADALAAVRGGPTAATDLLRRQAGGAVAAALFPDVARGLSGDVAEVLLAAAGAGTGVDYAGVARLVADQAGESIFRAIGREEAAIRADPGATRDPVLIALLTGAR